MKILLTGANGQLGTELQRHFANSSHEIVACSSADLNVADRSQTLRVIRDARPEAIVHGAAFTNVDGCETDPAKAYAVNAIGTRNVAEAASSINARVAYISSDYVFNGAGTGPNGGGAYTEWDVTGPISHYGRSKLGGETEVQAILGPKATVIRASWVVGEFGNNFLKTMLRLANDPEGKPLTVVDDQRGCPTFTRDLAQAIEGLLTEDLPGVFHVSNAGPVSWCEFAKEIFAGAGADASRVQAIPTSALLPARPAPRPAFSILENAALRAVGLPPLPHWHDSMVSTISALK